MADVPVGAVPAPATPAAPAAARAPDPSVARAAKLASVSAGLAKLEPVAPAPAAGPTPVVKPAIAAIAEPARPAAVEAPPEPAEPAADKKPPSAPAAKPDDKTEPVDDKTAKAIAAIDRRAAAFRQEQATATAKLDLDRAELARLRAEVDGRGASHKELAELAARDPVALLERFGVKADDEDRWEHIGRSAYVRTKAGKADPRAAPAVQQTAKERELATQLADLKAQQSEIADYLRTQTQQQQSAKFVGEYLDSAVKAIPAAPSLIGKLYAKSPEKARQALLATGKAMEREAMVAEGAKKYDPSHTPSHDELIARYEKNRRAELEEHGVDVDALLAPAAPAKPVPVAAKASATIDPNAVRGTRPVNENPTREERLAAVSAGLKKLDAAQN